MKRDLYIDFAKGMATLSVILIHSCFFSGQFYVPGYMRNISLLLDVVLFFALSGFTSGNNIEKTCYRLIKLQITYMLFVTLIFFMDWLVKWIGLSFFDDAALKNFYLFFGEGYVPKVITARPQWENLFNWYVHAYVRADAFPVIMGSFWYLKVYFILSFLGVLILKFFPQHIIWFIAASFGLTAFWYVFPDYYPNGQAGYVALYLGVFLLANLLRGKKLSLWIAGAGLLVSSLALALLVQQNGWPYMNKFKFPPKMPYILWISFGVILLFTFYNRLKINRQNLITWIGTNAIFFYFAQGISSTVLYFPVHYLKDELSWFVLLPFMWMLNVGLAVIIAKFLMKYDAAGWKFLEYLRKKTASAI